MRTQNLYKILDKILPKECCYNLRKSRNTPVWRVRIWCKEQLDRLGILAPYIQDELYPDYCEFADMKSDFLRMCEVIIGKPGKKAFRE